MVSEPIHISEVLEEYFVHNKHLLTGGRIMPTDPRPIPEPNWEGFWNGETKSGVERMRAENERLAADNLRLRLENKTLREMQQAPITQE